MGRSVSPCGPEGEGLRSRALLAAARRAFESAGASVRVFPDAANLLRRRDAGEASGDEERERPFVVEVEGLSNLLHELAHFALRGHLEVDHGYDYALIPFDTRLPRMRGWLFEELCSCLVSAAYLSDATDAEAWLDEQLGIQHHFFGDEDARAFLARAERVSRDARGELEEMLARAYRQVEQRLAEAGAGPTAVAPRRLGADALSRACRRGREPSGRTSPPAPSR